MKVVFRVDSSTQIGGGHSMRCLSLADALRERGVHARFICREHAGNLTGVLQQNDMPVTLLPGPQKAETPCHKEYAAWLGATAAEDAEQTIAALDGAKPDWLVVDHYGLDIDWETRLRPHVRKILVIDDFAGRRHDCDALLDQNYSPAGQERYSGFVSPWCRMLLGPKYALLHKEFKAMRESLGPKRHELKSIMVFLTSGNDQGETIKAMRGIEMFGKAESVDVVVGRANPNREEIVRRCAELEWRYHCQVDYMPRLIADADLVIGAGGSSNWERCALGTPALVVVLAENQEAIAQALGRAGAVYNLGWCRDLDAADYADALLALNHDRLAAMTERSLALVDARGAERMADVLLAA